VRNKLIGEVGRCSRREVAAPYVSWSSFCIFFLSLHISVFGLCSSIAFMVGGHQGDIPGSAVNLRLDGAGLGFLVTPSITHDRGGKYLGEHDLR